ncbi:hypothetical protein CLV31_12410 [Algoriphagus aquaeductus]|uniref:Dolichyl-phosphate-mannose-protein mannosyltransferase n=1 Tax=Algoriphagus aquaeductus TaxID=475299 RepID=A0A326RIS6_9BACT|nr:hypothetical protein [Algoriphagus aquaeductus]PZV76685.1 hypothetical protein CLV31_12410 [Algoriphagus aquaeductus]
MTGKASAKIGIYLIGATLSVVVLVFAFFQVWIIKANTPYYGDEHFYVKNAESFYLHHTLEAAFSYTGNGSKLLGADAHGPAYPLLHGGISKLIGWNIRNIPVIHLVILSISILLFWMKSAGGVRTKLLQILLLLGCPVTLFYSMTFMPELLHLAGGIVLFLLMEKHLAKQSSQTYAFLLLWIAMLGLFRSTWFFALIGLMVIPCPLQGFKRAIYPLAGLGLAFFMQYYFHEQVPNGFSAAGNRLSQGHWITALSELYFNTKRNLYFLLTYTEGWFYTLQKIWLILSLLLAAFGFKREPMIRFGVVMLLIQLVFTLVFYKNYDWVDLRMYTPWVIFLNLCLLAKKQRGREVLVGINLTSFILILPLVNQLLFFRTHQEVKDVPKEVLEELGQLSSPALIWVDPQILQDYALWQLPISQLKGEPIRYILPYYEIQGALPTAWLQEKEGQLRACPTNNRCQ